MSKLTAAQEKQVSDWFFKDFWPLYPAWLCNGDKGSRAKTLVSMLKVNPCETEQKRITGNLEAQIRAAKQNPNRKYWSIGTTYVNNRMWNDEIESTMEVRAKQDLKTCSQTDCNNEVHGPNYSTCSMHIECQHDNDLRAAWAKTGIKRHNNPNMRADCLEYLNSIGMGGYVKLIGVSNENT